MTTAKKALASLARTASGAVVALAEMTADDIIAGLNDEQLSALSASLAPAPAALAGHPEPDSTEPDGDPDDTNCAKCGEAKKGGKCAKCAPDSSASADAAHAGTPAYASGFAAASARAQTVISSEHFAGREKAAARMLGNAALSADEIVAVLGEVSPAQSAAAPADPEAAARAEMRDAIAATGNSNADASAGGSVVVENHGWAAIHDEIRARHAR